MATTIDNAYVDRFVKQFHSILSGLDAEISTLAAESQRDARAGLHSGQTVPSYKPTTIVGDYYAERARIAESDARRDIASLFDRLDRDAVAGRAEVASADEVATVNLALSLNPDEATLRDLWEAHHGNATLRRAIRQAAAKAGVLMPSDIADTVCDNRADAREYALSLASGRWRPASMAPLDFAPHASLDAVAVSQRLRGTDLFGKPL